MKKILLILILLLSSSVVCAQTQHNLIKNNNSQHEKTITSVSASPNPFSERTQISFHSSIDQAVIFTIKNLLGKTIFKEEIKLKKGKKTIPFFKNQLDSGMYIYSIQTDMEIVSKRLIIK